MAKWVVSTVLLVAAGCSDSARFGAAQEHATSASGAALSAGGWHTCEIGPRGLDCWGSDPAGTLEPPHTDFVDVSAGEQHTCGVNSDGEVQCWGSNDWGQADAPSGYDFRHVAAGERHTCALRSDGQARCWGADDFGQASPPAGKFVTLVAGYRHTCGLDVHGVARCWGDSYAAQARALPVAREVHTVSAAGDEACVLLRDGTAHCTRLRAPGGRFEAIESSRSHACGLRADGFAVCWGANDAGQASPPQVAFTSLMLWDGTSCGIRTDGRTTCWGRSDVPSWPDAVAMDGDSSGQCALDSRGLVTCSTGFSDQRRPARHLAVAGGRACVLGTDDVPTCWNLDGAAVDSTEPSPVNPPRGTYVDLSVGANHACALRPSGEVDCWGADDRGQCARQPHRFASVRVGDRFSCGILVGGGVHCWGVVPGRATTQPPGRFRALGAGTRHTCGLRDDGSIECWGRGYSSWRRVQQGPFVRFSTGPRHTCALASDGALTCWGHDAFAKTDAPEGRFSDVAAGGQHTCARRLTGEIVCWGWDTTLPGPPPAIIDPPAPPQDGGWGGGGS